MSSFFEYLKWLKNFHLWCLVASLQVYWLYWFWISSYARLKASWFFVHWLAELIYFWTCFANRLSSWRQIAFLKFLRSSYDKYTVHALLSDSLLWDSRKVSSFQSRWTRTIIYRVICDEMFAANLWFILACLDSVEMFIDSYFAVFDLFAC